MCGELTRRLFDSARSRRSRRSRRSIRSDKIRKELRKLRKVRMAKSMVPQKVSKSLKTHNESQRLPFEHLSFCPFNPLRFLFDNVKISWIFFCLGPDEYMLRFLKSNFKSLTHDARNIKKSQRCRSHSINRPWAIIDVAIAAPHVPCYSKK